jgi:hypothetical protein
MVLRDLMRAIEAVEPRSAVVEAEGEPPASFELLLEADGVGVPLPTFESEGFVRETPSQFESSGSFSVGGEAEDETHEIILREGGKRTQEGRVEKRTEGEIQGQDSEGVDGYLLEGSHVVGDETALATLLSSADGVRELVASEVGAVSRRLGAAVDTEVLTHRTDHGTRDRRGVVDAEYTARLTGLDRLSGNIGTEAGDGSLRIEGAHASFSRGDGLDCAWNLDVRNHGGLFTRILDEPGVEAYVLHEARQASGFTCELDWEAEHTERGLSAEARYETENASMYADELRNRGLETPSHTSFDFELDTRGSKTAVSFDSETHGDTTSSFGEGLEDWLVFLPTPAAFVYLHLPELHPTDGV